MKQSRFTDEQIIGFLKPDFNFKSNASTNSRWDGGYADLL